MCSLKLDVTCYSLQILFYLLIGLDPPGRKVSEDDKIKRKTYHEESQSYKRGRAEKPIATMKQKRGIEESSGNEVKRNKIQEQMTTNTVVEIAMDNADSTIEGLADAVEEMMSEMKAVVGPMDDGSPL